ncbi:MULTISPECIES: metallophosphoesterase [Mycobacterium]|uniref:Metallophosphatase n=1 Tax=Mycobacterium kiyosense TaxID=2871094 RepID=A0A9P3V001_9MYCO|nr:MULTISPECIES: metallophosphoesterase [Mycobacterium]BDB43600.1 metallophosphatase [Mycobacterium kiyosense]BDE13242.1 metallophosphatase [Mycobacterium sp. 20KCMC460]GLB85368.1 metallophosphatase [Mycobacterium kiyosense]GLB90655.1 metallophosphatase [Mycobacterium kiyosense]GLB96551.1 metallophosphatase [Mycobacterium kiyosense]
MQGYDIIGDIHGCAGQLERLLAKLDYRAGDGAYLHPERQAIFVGDLVDRGTEQLRVLQIVKAMVEAGSAQVVMGNHEFNAICYSIEYPSGSGKYLRPQNEKNTNQHREFLDQLTDGQRTYYLDWFATLPLWLDLGDIRVVHACWHEVSMKYVESQLGSDRFNSLDQFVRSSTPGDELFTAVEILLKGPEISLVKHGQPPFKDKDGHVRRQARIRWWDATAATLREIAEMATGLTTDTDEPYPTLPDIEVAADERSYVYTDTVPVFFGHYWRKGDPKQLRDWTQHCACVDFSAAKDGKLTAYRWSGEATVDPDNYLQLTD